MRNVWVIASKEFKQYFTSPLAYALAAMLYLILGFLFYVNINFGLQTGQITPDGRIVLGPMITILVFITPLLTMRLLADEQRMGTLELLLTAPVRDSELVVGKWLGAFGFMLVVILPTWIYPLIMQRMTQPGIDQGVLVTAYLGVALLLAAMLGIGTLVSGVFTNPFVAFLGTEAALLGLWVIGALGSGSGVASEVAGYLGMVDHFYNNLYLGVLQITDVTYYVSVTAVALFLGAQVIQARRWG
jgi:ABC-2 type transport system permease protein